jgi:hypothetical protein
LKLSIANVSDGGQQANKAIWELNLMRDNALSRTKSPAKILQ